MHRIPSGSGRIPDGTACPCHGIRNQRFWADCRGRCKACCKQPASFPPSLQAALLWCCRHGMLPAACMRTPAAFLSCKIPFRLCWRKSRFPASLPSEPVRICLRLRRAYPTARRHLTVRKANVRSTGCLYPLPEYPELYSGNSWISPACHKTGYSSGTTQKFPDCSASLPENACSLRLRTSNSGRSFSGW